MKKIATTLTLLFAFFIGKSQDSLEKCGQTISYFGENYPTVKIGQQCWFAKNLNVGIMIQSDQEQMNNQKIEKYCYNNDSKNCLIYGGLYQWAETVQYKNNSSNESNPKPLFSGNIKGICPSGWHIPSEQDFFNLEQSLGGENPDPGDFVPQLMSNSNLWKLNTVLGTNESRFSALPAGEKIGNHVFDDLGTGTSFWFVLINKETAPFSAPYKYLCEFGSNYDFEEDKKYGRSVRCIKD